MIRIIAVLSLPLLTALITACSTDARIAIEPPLKIAAWNIEHLAARDGSGCKPRTEADYAALRAYADRLAADVIAFAEVESLLAAQRVFTPDKYVVAMSSRPDSARAGFCGRAATDGPTIRKQDVGFAIRKSIRFSRNPDLRELAIGNPDLRWGVDITLQGVRPLRLLAVHLKSGCSQGAINEACPILFDQVPVLQQWIAARQEEGSAFMVVGDWNRRLAMSGDEVWQRLNGGKARLTTAAASRGARCIARYSDFIDHIVFDARAALRVRPDSFEEFVYGVAEDDYPSDHCPVAVTVDR